MKECNKCEGTGEIGGLDQRDYESVILDNFIINKVKEAIDISKHVCPKCGKEVEYFGVYEGIICTGCAHYHSFVSGKLYTGKKIGKVGD